MDYVHTREDYDFRYKDGRWGPIVREAILDKDGFTVVGKKHWCREHGWELAEWYPYPEEVEHDAGRTDEHA